MKRNFIKGIVCGLMLTTVVGSTVFAGTYDGEIYGYGKTNIRKEYYGSVGQYSAVGTQTSAYVLATNTTPSSRLYKVQYGKYHNGMNQYTQYITDSNVLGHYGTIDATGERVYNDPYYSYYLVAYGYNSTAEATGQADYFRYYIEQYDG